MSTIKSFNDFRKDIRYKIEEIFAEEQSVIAITSDNNELQDIVESYDENFSKPYIDILNQEIDSFKNKHTR